VKNSVSKVCSSWKELDTPYIQVKPHKNTGSTQEMTYFHITITLKKAKKQR